MSASSTHAVVPAPKRIDIEALLRNWAAWVRVHPHLSHCASLEHRYRSPQHWWPEAPKLTVDVLSALAVERAIGEVPAQHRAALIWHYVHFAPSHFICRRLALRYAAWEQFLEDSRTMLGNRLTAKRKGSVLARTIRLQPSTETLAPSGA